MYRPDVSDNVAATTLADVVNTLTRLGCQPTPSGLGYTAYCPLHETDGSRHTKSLTVAEGDRVPVVVHCHAGCDPKALLKVLDIHPAQTAPPIRRITHRYSYRTADGHEVRQKVRYDPKDFRIRHKKNGHWDYKAGSGPAVLYRLPEVSTAIQRGETIYLVEGEKDADRLAALGLIATTSIEGAWQPGQKPKWKPAYTEQLAGAGCVVLLADHDEAGRAYMDYIGQQLTGQVREIVRVDLGQLYGLPPKSDVSDWLDAGHTVDELQERVAAAEPVTLATCGSLSSMSSLTTMTTSPQSPPPFLWLDDFCQQPPETDWLVRGYLEQDCLAACFGDSEAGKSFLMIDLACHIAHGQRWCGRKVKPSTVLYVAGEGGAGLRRRFKAWHEYHGLPLTRHIAIRTVPAALCEPSAAAHLVELIKRHLVAIQRTPGLIALDTLNRNFGLGDENSTKDMSSFVAGMDALRMATGACVATVHHCGHQEKGRMRAAISLHNAVDFEYLLTRTGEREDVASLRTTMQTTKCKDHTAPPPLSWTWHRQSLPWLELDDDDNPVPTASCVLIPADYVKSDPSFTLTGKAARALVALEARYADQRKNLLDAGHDPTMARVLMLDWQKDLTEIETDRRNRPRLKQTLLDRGLIRAEGAYVYPACREDVVMSSNVVI